MSDRATTRTPPSSAPGGSARALRLWVAGRVGLIALVLALAALWHVPAESHPLATHWWWLDRFTYWDSFHFTRIADEGWFTATRRCCDQSYFPGYPLSMRWLSVVLPGPTALAGWVITLAAGLVAAWAVHGLAVAEGLGARGARLAVLLFAVAPFSVFLVAFYTEALFLAAAVSAWWAARRGAWGWAGVAATLACATRINGLFVWAGLLVLYAVSAASRVTSPEVPAGPPARPRRRAAGWLLLPPLPVLAYFTYLHSETGSWNAWREAQVTGWSRTGMTPWAGLAHQWEAIVGAPSVWLLVPRVLDLLAVLAGLGLTAALLTRRRWWPEATYVGLSVVSLMASSLWDSAGRYALTWFPAYLVLARVAQRPRWTWLGPVAVVASGLVALVVTFLFATRHWVG